MYVALVNRTSPGEGNRFTVKIGKKPILFASQTEAYMWLVRDMGANQEFGFGIMAARNGWSVKRATKAQIAKGLRCSLIAEIVGGAK